MSSAPDQPSTWKIEGKSEPLAIVHRRGTETSTIQAKDLHFTPERLGRLKELCSPLNNSIPDELKALVNPLLEGILELDALTQEDLEVSVSKLWIYLHIEPMMEVKSADGKAVHTRVSEPLWKISVMTESHIDETPRE